MTKRCTELGCNGGRVLMLDEWLPCKACRPEAGDEPIGASVSRADGLVPKVGSVWMNGSETWTVEGVYRDGVSHVAVRRGGRLTGAADTYRDAGPADLLAMSLVGTNLGTIYEIVVEPPKAETVEVGDYVEALVGLAPHGRKVMGTMVDVPAGGNVDTAHIMADKPEPLWAFRDCVRLLRRAWRAPDMFGIHGGACVADCTLVRLAEDGAKETT